MNKRVCVILSDSSNQLKDVNYNKGREQANILTPTYALTKPIRWLMFCIPKMHCSSKVFRMFKKENRKEYSGRRGENPSQIESIPPYQSNDNWNICMPTMGLDCLLRQSDYGTTTGPMIDIHEERPKKKRERKKHLYSVLQPITNQINGSSPKKIELMSICQGYT